MHLVRALQRGSGCLGQPDVADLAGPDELGERADRILDRNLRVDPMLVVEVDRRHAKAAEAAFDRTSYVLGTAVEPAHRRVLRIAQDAELGGEEHLTASALDGTPDELLVGVRAVDVGGVEEVDAEVQRVADGRDRFRVVPSGIEIAHPHAAQADGRDPRAVAAQLSCVHPRLRRSKASD